MRTDRRSFMQIAAMALGALAIPFQVAYAKVNRRVTLSQVIDVCHPAAMHELCKGNYFASDILNKAVADGRIHVMPLAASVEVPMVDGTTNYYEVEQFNIPHTWTARDEHQSSENKLANMAASLFRNGVESHDWHFERLLEDYDLLVSKNYRYNKGEIKRIPCFDSEWTRAGEDIFYFGLYTAYCKLPKGTLTRGKVV